MPTVEVLEDRRVLNSYLAIPSGATDLTQVNVILGVNDDATLGTTIDPPNPFSIRNGDSRFLPTGFPVALQYAPTLNDASLRSGISRDGWGIGDMDDPAVWGGAQSGTQFNLANPSPLISNPIVPASTYLGGSNWSSPRLFQGAVGGVFFAAGTLVTIQGSNTFRAGDEVNLFGVNGTTNANGLHIVTSATPNSFTINTTGNAAWTGGGFYQFWATYPLPDTAIVNTIAGDVFDVTHTFQPSPDPNVFQIDVSVVNTGTAAVHAIYRRIVEWDIPPTPTAEFVTIFGTQLPGVQSFTRTDINAFPDPSTPPPGLGGTDVTDAGPGDLGATVTLDLGVIPAGQVIHFKLFYGAAASRDYFVQHVADGEPAPDDAIHRLDIMRGNQPRGGYTLATPSSAGNPTSGSPNTFFFGFTLPAPIVITPAGTTVNEDGTVDTYTIVLQEAPIDDVIISLSVSPANSVTVTPAILIFRPVDWNIPQTITVAAVNDFLFNGTRHAMVQHSSTSTDPRFDPLQSPIVIDDMDVTVVDDELGYFVGGPNDTTGVSRTSGRSDKIIISPSTISSNMQVTVNGKRYELSANYKAIVIDAQAGADTIEVSNPSIPIFVDGGDGFDTLKVTGQSGYGNSVKLFGPGDEAVINGVLPGAIVSMNGIGVVVLRDSSENDTLEALSIYGRDGDDIFEIDSLPAFPVLLSGDRGMNQVIGPDETNTWLLNTVNAFTLTNATGVLQGTGIQNLTGGPASDIFQFKTGSSLTGRIDGGDGNDRLDYSLYRAHVTTNLQTFTSTGIVGFSNMEGVLGGTASTDVLTGPDGVLAPRAIVDVVGTGPLVITSPKHGLIDGLTVVVRDVEGETGANGTWVVTVVDADHFTLNGAISEGAYTGGGTWYPKNKWIIDSLNGGNVNAFSFQSMESLIGSSQDDTFEFQNGQRVLGRVEGGGGTDTLDFHTYIAPVSVNLNTSKATGSLGFSSIERFVGGNSGADSLLGRNTISTWTFAGQNAGTYATGLSSYQFAGFENLTAGTGNDLFQGEGSWTGLLNAGSGIDTLAAATGFNTWNLTGVNGGDLNGHPFSNVENLRGNSGVDTFNVFSNKRLTGKIDGGGGSDVLSYAFSINTVVINLITGFATNLGGISGIENFVGSFGSSTIVGPNFVNSWSITGTNAGTITNSNGTIAFAGFKNITGGFLQDTFTIQSGGGWTGTIDGGNGFDFLFSNAGTPLWTSATSGTLNGQKFVRVDGPR